MMWQPASAPTTPLYDPRETLDQYRARKRRAFGAFAEALAAGRVKRRLRWFYDDLVDRVGANRYAWVSVATLAAAYAVDEATIKRWLHELEQAGLIRRQRRMGASSLTYLAAYDRCGQEETPEEVCEEAVNTDNQNNQHKKEIEGIRDYRQNIDGSFFGPVDAPSISAEMRQDSIKRQHLTQSVGGSPIPQEQERGALSQDFETNHTTNPEIEALLKREQVADFVLAPALRQRPICELQAVSQYLTTQRNVRDRARLFAALVRDGFGARLLAGQRTARPGERRRPASSPATRRYAAAPGDQPASIPPELAAFWARTLTALRATIAPPDWETWLRDTQLVALDDDLAVVATPTVFGRHQLAQDYLPSIRAALAAESGQDRQVELVIGTVQSAALADVPHVGVGAVLAATPDPANGPADLPSEAARYLSGELAHLIHW